MNYVQDALNAQQLNELFDDVDDDMLMQASGNDGNHQQPSTNDAGDVTTKITDASDDDDGKHGDYRAKYVTHFYNIHRNKFSPVQI